MVGALCLIAGLSTVCLAGLAGQLTRPARSCAQSAAVGGDRHVATAIAAQPTPVVLAASTPWVEAGYITRSTSDYASLEACGLFNGSPPQSRR
jgi:hypothetical protein